MRQNLAMFSEKMAAFLKNLAAFCSFLLYAFHSTPLYFYLPYIVFFRWLCFPGATDFHAGLSHRPLWLLPQRKRGVKPE
jgi:hypothetical protein